MEKEKEGGKIAASWAVVSHACDLSTFPGQSQEGQRFKASLIHRVSFLPPLATWDTGLFFLCCFVLFLNKRGEEVSKWNVTLKGSLWAVGYSDVPRLLPWWTATVCPSCFCLFPHLEKVLGVRLSSVVERLPSFFITLGSVTSIPPTCNLSAQQNEVVASWIQSQYGMYISDPIPVPLPSKRVFP